MTPQYIIVQERSRDSSSHAIATVGALGAVGVLLYFLVKNLGFGGRGSASTGPGTAPQLPAPAPLPPKPIEFFVRGSGIFVGDVKTTLADAIALGTSARDVHIRITGDARHGDISDLVNGLVRAGVFPFVQTAPGKESFEQKRLAVSGNARGRYGAHASYQRWSTR